MAIGQSDGSIILSTKVDTSGINKGMNSIKGTIGKIGAAIGVAFGVSALVNFGKAAVNLASDLQEVQNVVDVAFGNMSYKAEEFAKSAIENFGISELSAKRTASTYMAMAKGMGIAEDVASDMAITMTGLTADIASFYNMSQERADVILKSVYTGETETLKQLGIVMTEVNLENFAMSKGITKNLSAMTQQEKTMLRYQFVLEQTRLAQGDFVRTQDSWANQTRILTERWKEMQRIFGEAFMMLGTLILPAINNLVYGLTKVAEFAKVAASNIYEMFTGKKFNEQEEQTKQIADNIVEQAENQEELNKEMKKTLAGFDDIQILSSQTAEATETSGDNLFPSTIGGGVTTAETSTEADTSKFQKIASAIKSTLADVLDAASKALLAVGLIVLFSGNILGGIGLIMAGGAAYVAVDTLGSENPLETLKGHLTTLEKCLVPALLGLGVLLLFLGMIPLGIGLILGGIAYWGYKEVQSEEYDTASFQDKLNVIIEAVSLGIVAIGVMLIFFGQIPLGIGLIIAGKELLEATEAKLEESGVTTKIQKFIDDNSELIIGVGIALVVIALILFAFGIFSPLSLGLLVAGGSVLATAEEIKPGAIKEVITNFFKDNAGLIAGISTALLIIGILLCVIGLISPLSIGMIVAGAAGLVTEIVLNWNAITTAISDFFKNNAGLIVGISIALLVIGILLCCIGFITPLSIGMIVIGAAGLVAEIALHWDAIKETVVNIFEAVVEWVKTYGMLVLGILLCISGVFFGVGLALIIKWVKGGNEKGIPFATAIVDKVKEIWDSVKKFWNENIAPIFTAEWWKSLGKKVMNGLNQGFEAGINGIICMFEKMINWIVDGLNSISFEIPDWVPSIGGKTFGFDIANVKFGRVHIPKLAQGAVLPGGKPFYAIVNDQPAGQTNIEAPLQTIVDAMNIALQNNGHATKEEHYYLNERELMSVIYRLAKGGENIRGTSLIKGGAF